MYEAPKITIDDKLTIQIYLCFILEQLGELTEDLLSDIVTEVDAVSGLEYFEALSLSSEKNLIKINEEEETKKLSLLPQGLTMAKEFFHRIPLSIREKTLEYGKYALKMADLERSIICRIQRGGAGEPCYLTVRFINEINRMELMNLKIYAPDYEQAKLMRERFYEKPSDIVTKIMETFIKDSFL